MQGLFSNFQLLSYKRLDNILKSCKLAKNSRLKCLYKTVNIDLGKDDIFAIEI